MVVSRNGGRGGKLACHIISTCRLQKTNKKGGLTMKSSLREAPPPKGSTTFPNSSSAGGQVFQSATLWDLHLNHNISYPLLLRITINAFLG